MSNPIAHFYLLGYADASDANRKRKRSVTQNYKLAYFNGWCDAKLNRPSRY